MRGRPVSGVASVWLLAVAFPLVFASGDAETKIVNRIVAKVNDEVITQGDLDRLIREHVQALQVYDSMPLTQARSLAESESRLRLEDLIANTLLEQEARRDEEEDPTLVVDQLMLDEEIANFREQQGLGDESEFRRALGDQGYTTSSFRREMLRNVRVRELYRREIIPRLNVTADEVTAHYEENRAEYENEETARAYLREQRFAEERDRMIAGLREDSFVQILVDF